jgi:hypothetical protein
VADEALMAPAAPPPRRGLAGAWDRLIGPGATRAEVGLIAGAALLAGLAVPLFAVSARLGWTAWQLAAGSVLAADVAGGVVATAARPAQGWYQRPGRGAAQRLAFVAAHGTHIFIVAWLFRDLDWAYFAGYFAFLLGAAWLALRAPAALRRPAAAAGVAGAVFLNSLGLPAPVGMEWFVPLLFVKVLAVL